MEVASLKAENAVLQKKGFDSRLSNVSSACTPRSNLPSGRESDFVPAVEKIKEIDNAQMPENGEVFIRLNVFFFFFFFSH